MKTQQTHEYVNTTFSLHSNQTGTAVDVYGYLQVMSAIHDCVQRTEGDLLRRLLRISGVYQIAADVVRKHGPASAAESGGVVGDLERAAWDYYIDHSDDPIVPHDLIDVLRIIHDHDDSQLRTLAGLMQMRADRNEAAKVLIDKLEKIIIHHRDAETFLIDPNQANEIIAWQGELDATGLGDDDKLRELFRGAPAGADTTLLAAYLHEI